MYKKILVPVSVNQMDIAKIALQAAKELCDADGEIVIMNAHEPLPGTVTHYFSKEDLLKRDQEIRDSLAELADGDSSLILKLISGRAGVAIVEYAESHDIDCIVIASHRPELKDYLLGSTASRVVRHSPCSVLVIR